jgi:hypothetical protein
VETGILLKPSLPQVPNHDLAFILCPSLLRFIRFRVYISLMVLTSVNFDPVVPNFCFPFPAGLHGVDGEPKEEERATGVL